MDYAALNYPCPYCKAKIGEYCHSLPSDTIYRTSAHTDREALINKPKNQNNLQPVSDTLHKAVQPQLVMIEIQPEVFIPIAVKPIITRYAIRTSARAVLFQHPIYDSTLWIPQSCIHSTEIHDNSTIVYVNQAFIPEWH